MIDSARVKELLEAALEKENAFLIDFQIDQANKILITADTLEGVRLEELTAISRAIEHSLDRETEDFELQVSSPGVGNPLKVPQQYQQNIGRNLKVTTAEGKEWKGELTNFENELLTLAWKERVPKEVGKGKVTVTKEIQLKLEEIKEARVELRFN